MKNNKWEKSIIEIQIHKGKCRESIKITGKEYDNDILEISHTKPTRIILRKPVNPELIGGIYLIQVIYPDGKRLSFSGRIKKIDNTTVIRGF